MISQLESKANGNATKDINEDVDQVVKKMRLKNNGQAVKKVKLNNIDVSKQPKTNKKLNIETTQQANAGTKHFVWNIDESLFQKLIKYQDHSILNEKELKTEKTWLVKIIEFCS